MNAKHTSKKRAAALLLGVLAAGCRAEPETPLARAAAAGRVAEIHDLVAGGAGVEEPDGLGFTPLVWAARNGQVDAVRVLVAAGADPDRPAGSNGWTPLLHAIHKDQDGAVLVLLELGADAKGPHGAAALQMAAFEADVVMVRALLARGADPRSRPQLLADAVGGPWYNDYESKRTGGQGCVQHAETVRLLLDAAPDLRLGRGLGDRFARTRAKLNGCSELVALVR